MYHNKLRPEGSPINFIFVVFRAPKGQLLLARGSALGWQVYPRNAPCKGSYITQHASSNVQYASFIFHISIFQSFNLVGLFMRKSPTMNLSKWGTQVTNSYFAPKYAKNEGLAQPFVYQKSIIFTKRKDNSRVAKAPFLHPESSALGIPYTMF